MKLNELIIPSRENLSEIESSLSGMYCRLLEIVAQHSIADDDLVEITALLNNVSYIFLYLEAIDDQDSYQKLKIYLERFYEDKSLDKRILSHCLRLNCENMDIERSRVAYVKQLEERLNNNAEQNLLSTLTRLSRSVEKELAIISKKQCELLATIGCVSDHESPDVVFYKLAANVSRATTREKLHTAWESLSKPNFQSIRDNVDQMILAKKNTANKQGYQSTLAKTLEKTSVTFEVVEELLHKNMVLSIKEHVALEEMIREDLHVKDKPMNHFGYYMQQRFKNNKPVLFELDRSLQYIFDVAANVFDVDVFPNVDNSSNLIRVDVYCGPTKIGRINFDLWNNSGLDRGANSTLGILNRTNHCGIVQLPEAYVSCRFIRNRDNESLLTFQNVHSLFHEFGHALNHLLIKERIPNRSGLEYLPLERLEFMSMWFEKWCYHPSFNAAFVDKDISVSQFAKKLEYKRIFVEKAVTALLDFYCHSETTQDIQDCYNSLDKDYGISCFVALNELLPYFTRPMFAANPGANFIYLWGSAFSCERYLSYKKLRLDELNKEQPYFESCFRFNVDANVPDIEAIFTFYNS